MLENEKAARDRDIIILVVVVVVQLLEIIIPFWSGLQVGMKIRLRVPITIVWRMMSSRHTGITKDRYMMIDDVFRDLKITVVPTNIKKFLTAEINIE